MVEIKIDKKLNNKKLGKSSVKWNGSKVRTFGEVVKSGLLRGSKNVEISPWNFIFAYVLFFLVFGLLIINISELQIVQGSEMLKRSESNTVRITQVPAERGVIFDADGMKLVENVASMNVYLSVEAYLNNEGEIDNQKLENAMNTLGGILGDSWKKVSESSEYSSLSDKVYSIYMKTPYFSKILLASDIDNDIAINIKSRLKEIPGITIDNGNKRKYIYNEYFTHILGYTGEASDKDVETLSGVLSGDIVGKAGVERIYNTEFAGKSGKLAEEVDAFGKTVSKEPYTLESPKPGQNLYLTVKKDMQIKMFDLLSRLLKRMAQLEEQG
jgi:penicillin-binding protein 2